MPMSITNTTGGTNYTNPWVGGPRDVTHIKLDVSTLTTNEVDADGYLKPGVPLSATGDSLLGDAYADVDFYGVTIEAIKIVAENPTNTTLGNDTSDPLIAVGTSGLINRDIAEDNLGRVYTTEELAGFAASRVGLTTT